MQTFERLIGERIAALQKLQEAQDFIIRLGQELKGAGKIILLGNGGSAAQASHFSAELMVRYKKEREKYYALSLGADPAVVSAISNDYSFDDLFAVQIKTIVKPGDLVVAFSTSGNSKNILKALRAVKDAGGHSVALLGKGGGQAKDFADFCYVVPSDDTAIIQEIHLALIHLVCEYVDL